MAGLPITTYKYAISYSDDNITYGAFSAYTSLSSIATSFSIGSLNNGRYYKIKVRAVNALGDGEESQVIGPFRPAYAAAATVASATSTPNAVAPNRGVRTFTVTVTPPSIVNFSYAVLQTKLSTGAWTTREASITNTGSTSYTYSATASEVYSARLITYNTDGYSETTEIASNISIPALIDDSYNVPAFAGSGYHAAVAAYWDSPPYDAFAGSGYHAAVAYVAPVAESWGGDTWSAWQAKTQVCLNGSATGSKYFTSIINNADQQPNGIQARNMNANFSTSLVSNGGDGSTRAVCYVVNGVRYFIGSLAQNGDGPVQAIARGTGGNWGVGATGSGWSTNNTSGISGSAWYYCDVRVRYQYRTPAVAEVAAVAAYWDSPPYDAFAGSGYHAAVAAYWDSAPYDAYTVTQSY
jgi:hypothetical protein